jgi:prepilin-type N-terminal cleavage/methylation domain-containing protein
VPSARDEENLFSFCHQPSSLFTLSDMIINHPPFCCRTEPCHNPWTGAAAPLSRGMTIIEVMISVAILATVLTILAGNIFTLSVVRQVAKEEAIVQELMTGLIERIQSEPLSNLGVKNEGISHLNAWSWHRRLTPRYPETQSGVVAPMTEVKPTAAVPMAADSANVLPFSNYLLQVYDKSDPPQLISPGLLSQPSGVQDLKVYLEYYRQTVMLNDLLLSTTPTKTWKEITTCTGAYLNRNELIYSDDLDGDNRLDLSSEQNAAVLIRAVVTWKSRDGGQRQRELTLARRQ